MTVTATEGNWIEIAGRGLIVTAQNVGLLLDTVRQVRRMSVEAGASYYGVFLVSRTTPRPALALCFDRKFPRNSELSRTLCGERGMTWLDAAGRSMIPCWWPAEAGDHHRPAFAQLSVGQQTPPLTPEFSGLALPAFADDGAQGFVVLAGEGLDVDDALICDLHLRTLTLFGAVARMLLSQTGEVPAMSKRELQCLQLTARGRTSDEIAAALGLSIHTANQYLTATTQKLNAVNRMHAVAKALRLGLID